MFSSSHPPCFTHHNNNTYLVNKVGGENGNENEIKEISGPHPYKWVNKAGVLQESKTHVYKTNKGALYKNKEKGWEWWDDDQKKWVLYKDRAPATPPPFPDEVKDPHSDEDKVEIISGPHPYT